MTQYVMLDFVYVTFFKCLCDIILLHFLYIRPMHTFVVHRKGQIIGVTSVVLTLVSQSNDIVVCHCCFLYFAFWNWLMQPGSQQLCKLILYWLLNQDACQLRYKSWILSAPFAKQFHVYMYICMLRGTYLLLLVYNFIIMIAQYLHWQLCHLVF